VALFDAENVNENDGEQHGFQEAVLTMSEDDFDH
jgi:hypothetical protein